MQTNLDVFFKKKSTSPSTSVCESASASTSDAVHELNMSGSNSQNDCFL